MKKKSAIHIMLTLVPMLLAGSAFACTSFAVYSNNALYGMNFDYPETDLRFIIYQNGDTKLFAMEFKQGNGFLRTVGMNDKGLFASLQLVYPVLPAKPGPGKNELYVWQLENLIKTSGKIEDLKSFAKDKRLVPFSNSVHGLFADKLGNSMIVEALADKGAIIEPKGKFSVMTNFLNSSFVDRPYTEVSGVGSDRYTTAYEYISGNLGAFDIQAGWETLKRTAQGPGSFPTICSLIFDPQNRDIYFALKRDFGKIWKISLQNGTITQYAGFASKAESKLPAGGILASEISAK